MRFSDSISLSRSSFRVIQELDIAADPRNGQVYVARTTTSSGNTGISLSKRFDRGGGIIEWKQWVISDDPPGTPECPHTDQFFSLIAVDDRGWVHAIWQESCDFDLPGCCDDPPPACGQEPPEYLCGPVHTVYAYSMDAFDADVNPPTFVQQRLDPNPLLPPCGTFFIGDYLGIDVVGNQVYPLYPGGHFLCGVGDFEILTNQIHIGLNEADLDGSGDVGPTDYTTFQNCFGMSGQGVPAPSGCGFANLDGDCDADCTDRAIFRCGWTDPAPRPEACAEGCALQKCCGDFDGNGQINLQDFATFSLCFGTGIFQGACSFEDWLCADFTDNCSINLQDFATFSFNFGKAPSQWDCGGCPAGASASGPPDVTALAEWTVMHVPEAPRRELAKRCESAADSASDLAEAERLRRFADLIRP